MISLPGGPWQLLDEFLAARGIRFAPPTLVTTTGGTHAARSFHKPEFGASARDYGRRLSDMPAILSVLVPWAVGRDAPLAELFGVDAFYKEGVRIVPSKLLFDGHQTHVHAALWPQRVANFRQRWMAEMRQEEDDMEVPVDALADPEAGVWVLSRSGRVRPYRGARDFGDYTRLLPKNRQGVRDFEELAYGSPDGYKLRSGAGEWFEFNTATWERIRRGEQ